MNSATSPTRGKHECQPLFDACTPLVYSHNAFRITGLVTDASVRDIKRRLDDLKAAAEIGDAEGEHTHAYALKPAPSLDQLREATQRLHDPERRLIEEFFWFWPQTWGKGKEDQALIALSRGDKDGAFKIWSDGLYDDAAGSAVAKHNLAVMFHMVALDSERSFQGDSPPPLPETVARIDKYWRTCFKWWEELTDDETFWGLVSARIRQIDDPRLTTGFSRRMRAAFPTAVDRINALLAVKYAEIGKYDLAKKHVGFMEETHKGMDDVEQMLALIMRPLETRVQSAITDALSAIRKDARAGATIVSHLIHATKEPLAIAKNLLNDQHSIRFDLFESVCDTCFTCAIAYGNATEDWPTCIALMKQVEPLAVTDAARAKIRANLAVAATNNEQKSLREMCWFCKKQKGTTTGKCEVKMYGEVVRTPVFNGTRLNWKNLTVTVPRCDSCKKAHEKNKAFVGADPTRAGALTGAAAGTVILPGVGSIIGLIAGGIAGKLIDRKRSLPAGVASEWTIFSFPDVKILVADGWLLGDKPPG